MDIALYSNTMTQEEAIQKAVEHFQDNDITDFCMECATGMVSDEPRTLEGYYPGDKTLAMGYALATVEMAEENGLDAEREYIDEVGYPEELDIDKERHKILIHIEGGSDE